MYRNIYILIAVLFISCEFPEKFKREEQKKSIAKVYNKFLYQSEIDLVLASNITKQDSALFCEKLHKFLGKTTIIIAPSRIKFKR